MIMLRLVRLPKLLSRPVASRWFSQTKTAGESEETTELGVREYSEFLEAKQALINDKKKTELELPTMPISTLHKTLNTYRLFSMLDARTSSLIEKEFLTRISMIEDMQFESMVLAFCQSGHKFGSFDIVEKRLLHIFSEMSKQTIGEKVMLVSWVMSSGQPVSDLFKRRVIELFSPAWSTLTEEGKLYILRAMLTSGMDKDSIPKAWLAKLSDIKTTKEFVISAEIIKTLTNEMMDNYIPEAYRSKVHEFASQESIGSTTLHIKLVEVLESLKDESLGLAIGRLVVFLRENMKTLSFTNLIRGMNFLSEVIRRHPSTFNLYSQELHLMSGEIVEYMKRGYEEMSINELTATLRVYLTIIQATKTVELEWQDTIERVVLESVGLINQNTPPEDFISLLKVIKDLLGSQHQRRLLESPPMASAISRLFNSMMSIRLQTAEFLFVFDLMLSLCKQLSEAKVITPQQAAMMMEGPVSKAASLELPSFETFVQTISMVDSAIELVGSKDSRSLELQKERILSRLSSKRQHGQPNK